MGIRPHHAEPSLTQVNSEPHQHHSRHSFRVGMWQKIQNIFAKDDPTQSPVECTDHDQWPQTWAEARDSNKPDSSTRPLAVGLPRQATFRRQNSERRDRLFPIEPCPAERRALSSTRHASTSLPRPRASSSPPYWDPARVSAPAVAVSSKADAGAYDSRIGAIPPSLDPTLPNNSEDIWSDDDYRPPRPPSTTSSDDSHYPRMLAVDDKPDLRDELDSRWILNLSMHFRDKSDREKFFVTYAETPTHWRRVTVSCDYRNAEPGSLEMDLKELQFQRDKSMQIYESIRDSLPEIQFYETVTNLKLETTDGRLHVHVTEDVNEIIPYPPRYTVAHILSDEEFSPMEVRESDLTFDSHLSGFVYKIRYKGKVYIKKEIPGPDTVDEFLYEINALHALHGSSHVIQLEAIVLDDTQQSVRGLLISYAEKGAIVDLLYDHRGSIPWEDRCRWAEQSVRGLSEIHEEGYVQGDFTLSNIVVNGDGNARIIDINRRGCPVGWEPPEIATKIASNQRISMYIGEKSDLYQLGMTLWALAMDDDEPERHVSPLSVDEFPSEVPDWYQDIVRTCLSPRPRDRLSAKELVEMFPSEGSSKSTEESHPHKRPTLKLRTRKEYIDPAAAVERDDIERFNFSQHELGGVVTYSPESSRDDYTFTYPRSSNYEFDSETSGYERGRRPPTSCAHLGPNETPHRLRDDEGAHPITDPMDDPEPNIVAISPGVEREFDEVELDGHPYLISRRTFNDEEREVLERAAVEERDFHDPGLSVDNPGLDVAGSLDSSEPLPERRSSFPTAASTTSDSTPRNSHAILPTLAHHQPDGRGPEPKDPQASEAADCNPDMDNDQNTPQENCLPHSITTSRDADVLMSNATECPHRKASPLPRVSSMSQPPGLPYADSGYDEPLGLTDDDGPGYLGVTSIEDGESVQEVDETPISLVEEDTTHQPPTADEAHCFPEVPGTTSLQHDITSPEHQVSELSTEISKNESGGKQVRITLPQDNEVYLVGKADEPVHSDEEIK
ncbi:uncharacterized protein Z518_08133 [Rhinocladiella mackenziei CBS 650.93]|uniref:Protein kinase domain-containing protein n=1 Tax=Rhinocladiella mackenziei CBS 650.93 TaxID=1442369 RepID=A0A0D2I8K8_9EURO|nr:uncharacterized protein Z518_08133 [Rhinocladiella mackenziei CBS 650.93]KIX02194.1 hypothetical protein Z518_08133 [Rhinocladiella mackenziei CBS 650.93]